MYLETPLFFTLEPAYKMLDTIWHILEKEGHNVENSNQYRDNLFAWTKLNRIWGFAQDQLDSI